MSDPKKHGIGKLVDDCLYCGYSVTDDQEYVEQGIYVHHLGCFPKPVINPIGDKQ